MNEKLKLKIKNNEKYRILFRYKFEIQKLRNEGMSYREIAKWIGKTHKKKVSYVTIHNFLKELGAGK